MIKDETFASACEESVEDDHSYIVVSSSSLVKLYFLLQDFKVQFFFYKYVSILLIIEKVPSPVHWGCTIGAQIRNQNYTNQEK